MGNTVLTHPGNTEPVVFTRDELGWLPWLEPLQEEHLTEKHWTGLVDRARSRSPYFMLLARDPEVLGARTRLDKDVFYNTSGGLARDARELAAAAVSRVNGCIYCASVHARFAATYSKRADDIDRFLETGSAEGLDPRWTAVVEAATALTLTPSSFTADNAEALLNAGFEEEEIADLIYASAFFNWANRLMLSLGEASAN